MLAYVNIRLPNNVLDSVDPRFEFSTLEYGHCRGMRTRGVGTWSTNFSRYAVRPPHFSPGAKGDDSIRSIGHSTAPAIRSRGAVVKVEDNE